MRAEAGGRRRRERRFARLRRVSSRALRRGLKWGLWAVAAALALLVVVGVIFAGSSDRIPAGVSVAGIKLSGLTTAAAEDILRDLGEKYGAIPVVVTAEGRRWNVVPESLDVRVDWAAVVAEARAAGDGPLPLRGLKRVRLRLFGTEIQPRAELYESGLDFRISEIAAAVAVPAREAALELVRREPQIVPAQAGRELDTKASKVLLLDALGGFEREPIALPVRVDPPLVTAETLRPVAAQVRRALAAPVRFSFGEASWRVRPGQLAGFLVLPSDGESELGIGGPKAERYFKRLAQAVERKPKNAEFAVAADGTVGVIPGLDGRALDSGASGAELLRAAVSTQSREAALVVRTAEPKLTTEEARAMGIRRVLSSYATLYAGTTDRIQNLQLAVTLLNGTLLAPGETFSFNDVVGPRTEERGFRLAPVIIGDEYEEGVGGGVSQVATTVFNAVWEAGLKIAERNPHALYISRYQLGRDATVNYPNLDLKFVNDTKHWLMLRGGYDDTGISITILGPATGRRVVSEAGPLEEVGPPKLEKGLDPTLFKGERVVDDAGEPARRVTVTRTVYRGDGVLYDETWTTSYRSEPRIVRVGTKPKPVPEEPAPGAEEPATTDPAGETSPPPAETTPTETTPAETAPTVTTP